ncbi:hypothetical protein CEXT_353001 [Caerostris extrusa]|uniref:Uncharacterized protein n=1 Tax=Caerostris extrusa TaxID=172846 RepID=A0AAV4Q1Z1_CAEEX|nr:hypothetical protein CEXT_353001 [Caerostris extrusa]
MIPSALRLLMGWGDNYFIISWWLLQKLQSPPVAEGRAVMTGLSLLFIYVCRLLDCLRLWTKMRQGSLMDCGPGKLKFTCLSTDLMKGPSPPSKPPAFF